LYGRSQANAQWQLSTSPSFAFINVSSTITGSNSQFTLNASSGLVTNTLYYARVRYSDDANNSSEYSNTVQFTSNTSFPVLVDFLVVDGEDAYIVDYKTGNNKYPDVKQLKLMALMIFEHYPEVRNIKAGLMFVMHNSFITEEYVRDTKNELWDHFTPDLERLKLSYEQDVWHKNPTPLCGWCPVKSCEHHKER
jgi:hypothetical protein